MARISLEKLLEQVKEKNHDTDLFDRITWNDKVNPQTIQKLDTVIAKCKQARRELGV